MDSKRRITMNCPLCESSDSHVLTMETSEVYQCNQCTLQYIDDKEFSKKKDYLKNYKKSRDENSVLGKLRKIQYSLDAEHLQKFISKGKVLDVGCSTGEFLLNLSRNSKLQLYGIDLDKDAISLAKKRYGFKIQFFNCDLINYQTNLKYDCIVFRGSFQFLGSDLSKTLKKISKIFSENFRVIIYGLPNSDSILYYFLKDRWNLFDKLSHTLIFNRKSILKLCEIYNYKILEFSYPYLETPYANLKDDYESLIRLIRDGEKNSFPFYGNIMQIVLEK